MQQEEEEEEEGFGWSRAQSFDSFGCGLGGNKHYIWYERGMGEGICCWFTVFTVVFMHTTHWRGRQRVARSNLRARTGSVNVSGDIWQRFDLSG